MPRFAANISFLFTEHPFLDRFQAAADAGFKGVEFLFPEEGEMGAVAEAARRAGVAVVLFNAALGDWDAGERGIGALAGRENAFFCDIYRAAANARAWGCPRLHVMAGLVPAPDEHETAMNVFCDNLAFAASHLAGFGIEATIEAINPVDMPGYLLGSFEDALGVLDRVPDNVFLQYDLYHGAVMGHDTVAMIERHFDRIRHVQVAGHPGRHEPDSDTTDFTPAFEKLDALGYDGWVGCEYQPHGATLDGLGWLNAWR